MKLFIHFLIKFKLLALTYFFGMCTLVAASEVSLDFTKGYVGYALFSDSARATDTSITTAKIKPPRFSAKSLSIIRISNNLRRRISFKELQVEYQNILRSG